MKQTTSAPGSPAESPPSVTAMGRYEQLVSDREPYLKRGRDAAELTIPALLPPEGSNGSSDYARPWQAVGARGVNNLAAKLLLVLFPPGASFFKLSADTASVDALKGQAQGEDVEGQIQAALSKVERTITQSLESSNLRVIMAELLKHLVAIGNALLFVGPDGTFKWFRLSKFVVVRDLEGNVLEILVKESLGKESLPPAARDALASAQQDTSSPEKNTVDLYTSVSRQPNGSFKVFQEIAGVIVKGSTGTYPAGKSAWIPLCWARSDGEHYGRGLVDDYLGDLVSLEALSQALTDGAAAMARFVTLVDEAGVTSRKKIAEAPNLSVIDGNAKDISVLSMAEKTIDLNVTRQRAQDIEKRLEQAFLLTSSIQRDAERVTAEEIRLMANELEQSLGGVYAGLGKEFQLPLVERTSLNLQKRGKLPALPDKSVTFQIVTGIDGLGRSSEFARLDMLTDKLAAKFGPEAVAAYVNVGAYAVRGAAALGLDIDGVIRSEEEVQQARQAQMQSQLAQSLGPDAIKAQAQRDVAATKTAEPPQ